MKIVVLAGGISTERDVSIISSKGICDALRAKGHKVVLLDVYFGYNEKNGSIENIFENETNLDDDVSEIKKVDPDINKVKALRGSDSDSYFGPHVIEICKMADIVYMGLHGADGENGKVQATFDMFGIKYTGTGAIGSSLGMDKGIAKKIFMSAGIPTPVGFAVKKDKKFDRIDEVKFPCVVKPCNGGSSVGVTIVHDSKEYSRALDIAFKYEDEAVVEQYVKGREFSVGVINGKVLPVIEIIPKSEFYDYETKYQDNMATDVCPAELTEDETKRMQGFALDVYKELKLEVYGRIDFLMDKESNIYCLEANTLPGMTPHSLIPQEAHAVGIEYGDLCEQIIAEAFDKYNEKKNRSDISRNKYYGVNDAKSFKDDYMTGMTLEKITEVCSGKYIGDESALKNEVSSITTDSREVKKDSIFIAIKGERVDGNKFNDLAYEMGAICCMSEKEPENTDKPYIVVENIYDAIKAMATYYRKNLNIKVVGITGSVGKTTTKELVASVLQEKYNTLKTNGNFNNELGLPLTVFRLRDYHQIAVLEMGISGFGEMTRLGAIAQPDIAVITNIGQCHLENLGTRDGILKAKTEIFTSMKKDGKVYLNGDDDKLITVGKTGELQEPVFFGMDDKFGYFADNIKSHGLEGISMDIHTPDGEFSVNIHVPGKHMVYNALAATAIGCGFDMSMEQIKTGLERFKPVDGRNNVISTHKFTIIDDCYNANPISVMAGIDVLSGTKNRSVAILGDMFELGENTKQMHFDTGKYAAEEKIDIIICIGELSENIADGAKSVKGNSLIYYFKTKEEAFDKLDDIIKEGDVCLVKASHAMKFETIVEKLRNM